MEQDFERVPDPSPDDIEYEDVEQALDSAGPAQGAAIDAGAIQEAEQASEHEEPSHDAGDASRALAVIAQTRPKGEAGSGGKGENEAVAEEKKEEPHTETAVIDRFEGKWAVLLVGDEERSVPVLKSALPKRSRRGHWLKVQLTGEEGDQVVHAEVDPEATEAARKRIADKLALLRSGEYRN